MQNQTDNKTSDLFPEDLIISRLMCESIKAKSTKEGVFFQFRLQGMTNAMRESDLRPNDYLIGAAEYLVELCENSERRAKQLIEWQREKHTDEQLIELMTGARKPVVKNGTIGMTFETIIQFEYRGVIVEKESLVKLIALWVLTMCKGDIDEAYFAVNEAYLRIVNRDNVVQFERAA